MLGALVVIWLVFHAVTGGLYLTPRNLFNLSVQTSSVAVMATGMVFVIVTRNIDLSVGSLLGFLGMIMGVAQVHSCPRSSGSGTGALDRRDPRRPRRRRADRRLPGLAGRLPDDPGLHRHPGRPAGLARRRLVGHHRPDHRAARPDLPAARRRRRGHARRAAELDPRRASPPPRRWRCCGARGAAKARARLHGQAGLGRADAVRHLRRGDLRLRRGHGRLPGARSAPPSASSSARACRSPRATSHGPGHRHPGRHPARRRAA